MKKPVAATTIVNLRRAYFESRYGQLHVRTAFPSTGGFDEHAALLLLHDCPRSSREFVPFLPVIATDRSIYAADTPGYGASDPPPSAPTISDYAAAIGDFLDNLRLRRVDVLGHGTGAAIATELAIQRPAAVRRLIFVGLPVHTSGERAGFDASPYPAPPSADGTHAGLEWRRTATEAAPGRTLEQLAAEVADALYAGPTACWGPRAAFHWKAHERLPLVAAPALVLRPKDSLWEATLRARPLLKNPVWDDLPDLGAGLFGVAAADVAARVRRFLDR